MILDARLDVINSNSQVTVPSKKGGWWQGLSLQTKATIFAVAIATIPVILVGSIGYTVVSRSIENQVIERKKAKTLEISDKINRFMFERYGDILTLSGFDLFTDPKLKISLERKAELLEKFLQTYDYESIDIINFDRSVQVQNTKGTIPKGFIYKKGTEGIEYLEDAFKMDQPVIGYPAPAIVTKKFSLFAAAPIKVNGITNAVIRSRIPVKKLDEILKIYLSESDNYSIVDGRTNKIFSSGNPKEFGLVDKDRFPIMNQVLASDIPSAQIITVDGEENLVAYVKLPDLDGLPNLNWSVVLSTPTKVAFAAQRLLLIEVLLGTAITAILASILATAIARRATKPIIEATNAVSKLGKGELDTRLVVDGQDEIAQLGGNINLMASQLQRFLKLQASEVQLSNLRSEMSRLLGNEGLSELLTDYLGKIRTCLQCDRAVVYEFDSEFAGRITKESVDSGWTSAFDAKLSDPCIPKSIIEDYKQGRTVATKDVINAGFAPKHLELMHKLQIKSNLVAPIRQADKLYGLLIVHKCKAQHTWQEDEVAYLRLAGEQLGLALSGVQLAIEKQNTAEQERQRSEQLQTSLISLLGDVEGAASGDLTVRAQITADDIGIVADFFNAIIESLRDVVSQVKLSATQVNTSVGDNDAAIRQLAEEAIAQSNQITDTLQSVEEMTLSIQQVAKSASQAADASQLAANKAEIGGVAMAKTVSSIMGLRETVAETAKKVKRLGEASQQISKVVALIDQIALKTNMLAVNASIEAARAGEEGKGFAIVAEEVGALAAQSTSATKEIERIVESIQRETSEVVEAMESSTSQVVEGTKQVEEAKQSLGQILEASRQVNELFQSISIATTSQVNTSEVVKKLMAQVAAISQRSSFTSKEVSQALQETVEITKQLQESVGTFKVS